VWQRTGPDAYAHEVHDAGLLVDALTKVTPGRPVSAVFNPQSGSMELYFNSGGTLTEKYWSASGWYGPVNLGASISGVPAAIANPVTGATLT
jgi:hypothetical protein